MISTNNNKTASTAIEPTIVSKYARIGEILAHYLDACSLEQWKNTCKTIHSLYNEELKTPLGSSSRPESQEPELDLCAALDDIFETSQNEWPARVKSLALNYRRLVIRLPESDPKPRTSMLLHVLPLFALTTSLRVIIPSFDKKDRENPTRQLQNLLTQDISKDWQPEQIYVEMRAEILSYGLLEEHADARKTTLFPFLQHLHAPMLELNLSTNLSPFFVLRSLHIRSFATNRATQKICMPHLIEMTLRRQKRLWLHKIIKLNAPLLRSIRVRAKSFVFFSLRKTPSLQALTFNFKRSYLTDWESFFHWHYACNCIAQWKSLSIRTKCFVSSTDEQDLMYIPLPSSLRYLEIRNSGSINMPFQLEPLKHMHDRFLQLRTVVVHCVSAQWFSNSSYQWKEATSIELVTEGSYGGFIFFTRRNKNLRNFDFRVQSDSGIPIYTGFSPSLEHLPPRLESLRIHALMNVTFAPFQLPASLHTLIIDSVKGGILEPEAITSAAGLLDQVQRGESRLRHFRLQPNSQPTHVSSKSLFNSFASIEAALAIHSRV